MLLQLVLRGIQSSAAVRKEAEEFGDTIFLQAPANLTSARGPLTSTLLWLQCASAAWPHTAMIGKAEDDTWFHVPDIAASLRAAQSTLAKLGIRSMYFGMHESYYWNETVQRPFGFGHHAPFAMWQQPCLLNVSGNVSTSRGTQSLSARHAQHGPFDFAKGPLYLLTRGLAARLTSDGPTRQRAAEALGTAETRASGGSAGVGTWAEGMVWEDVWIGYALSRLGQCSAAQGRGSDSVAAAEVGAAGAAAVALAGAAAAAAAAAGVAADDDPCRLGVVSLTWTLYFEEWGFGATPGTVLWHAKTKAPQRPALLHRYMALRHCSRAAAWSGANIGANGKEAPASGPPRCKDSANDPSLAGGSCVGGRWAFCVDDDDRQRCSHKKADLHLTLPQVERELLMYGLRLGLSASAEDGEPPPPPPPASRRRRGT
jgi:hypothetical protein